MLDDNKAVQELLHEVAFSIGTLRKAKELYSDRLAPDFNIFDFLRINEMDLSRCLGGLLNSHGSHGQGSVFLYAFVEQFMPETWTRNLRLREVQLEKMTSDSRRIDIYLYFETGEIIAIENKPWAGDQKNQLHDYASYLECQSQGKDWHLIYLSNWEPTTDSLPTIAREKLVENDRYSTLTFRNLVDWLEYCASIAKAPVVRTFIDELVKFLRLEVNGELDMSERKEIKEVILATPKNLESAFQILKTMNAVKEELLATFKTDLEKRIRAAGLTLVWDNSMTKGWKSYAGFGIKFKPDDDFYLRFEFNSAGLHGLYWGLRRNGGNIKTESEVWTALNELISAQFGSGGKTKWWPWWNWIESGTDWGAAARNWDISAEPWKWMESGELVSKVIIIAQKMWLVLEQEQQLLHLKQHA